MSLFKTSVKNKKVLAIGDRDLDGVNTTLLFKFFLPHLECESVKYVNSKINDVDFLTDLFEQYEVILFADLAPQLETYNWLKNNNKDVWIFDHHKSTKESLGDLPQYVYGDTRSGSQIVFDFMEAEEIKVIPQALRTLIKYVNAYDMWMADKPEFIQGKWMNALLWASVRPYSWSGREETGYKYYMEFQLQKIEVSPDRFYFFPSERLTILKDAAIEKEATKKAFETCKLRTDSKGFKYIYFESRAKLSLIAHKFLSGRPNIDYVVVHNTFKKEERRFSLRSREKGVDVSLIAKEYGGGGHYCAAGIELSDDQFFQDIKIGRKHFG